MSLKEALFYEQLAGDKIKCTLCPWQCVIISGSLGICGVRQNQDGKLYSLIYEIVSSIAADPIEKKPLFHFYPGTKVLSLGTFGCNMRCGHCQNWQIAHVKLGKNLPANARRVPVSELVGLAKETNSAGIAWTYNEPTIWFEYALEGAKAAKAAGLYTVWVTNGYIDPEALDMIGPYLDAYRVDVKAFSNEAYKRLARVKDMQPVLDAAIRAKKKWNMHVEIVTLVVPTLNDDKEQLKAIAEWILKELGPETPWHVTAFMPCLEFENIPPTPPATLDKARLIGLETGLRFVYVGNLPGHKGENTYCPKCQKLLIERVGYQTGIGKVIDGKCGFCGQDLNIRS
ncbi:MAG: AmmeMemoRadiSam system radical SAM enzyme [Candidatus Saganbacteria bacterium]|nr:AmmeMemoRadiSam system radical SAM enzyme [Candidatus Saganbacteria bacterium]